MKKSFGVIAILAIMIVSLCGCISDSGDESFTIVDDTGREVLIEGDVETIVSIAPSNTEILFALGLGDKVVGVTEFCNYPAEALDIEKVGGFSTVNIERIIELEADIVFGTAGHEEFAEQLEVAGIPVVMFKGTTFDVILNDITMVGDICGAEDEAEDLVSSLQTRIDTIKSQTDTIEEKPSVFYMLWNDPIMSAGPGTFIHEIIEMAGGTNIAGDTETSWPVLDMESIIIADPDVIILAPHGSSGVTREQIMDDPIWATVNAVEFGNVFEMSDGDIINRGGPRVVDALEEIYGFMPSTTGIHIVDDTGAEYSFDSPAETAISMAPSNTEILFELGLGDNVIGVTDFCNYPAEAAEKESIGGFSTVNVERIVELDPDVVFGTDSESHREARDLLAQADIPVILFKAVDISTIYKDIQIVGEVMGEKTEAIALINDMQTSIAAVTSKVDAITDKKTVFYMIWNDPLMSAGPGTFIHEAIETAGGINIAGDATTSWPMYDMEMLITSDPDVILLAPHGSSGMSKQQVMDDSSYATITAVVQDSVFELSNGDIIQRAGPRIADAIEELYSIMYG